MHTNAYKGGGGVIYSLYMQVNFKIILIFGNIYFIQSFSLLCFGQGYLAYYSIKVDQIFQR